MLVLIDEVTIDVREKRGIKPLDMNEEHKMHSMPEGMVTHKASAEHDMREMGEPSKSHKTHRGRHEGHVTEDFKRRFIISLILTLPILALSPFIQGIFRFKLELRALFMPCSCFPRLSISMAAIHS
jgi:hypothetical protein